MCENRRKCILLTGGSGYIGTHVLVQLLEMEIYDIVVVDNYINSYPESLINVQKVTNKSFDSYNIDLLDENGLNTIFNKHKIDCVIHLAGLKNVGESVKQPLSYYHNNVGGMLILLKIMNKYNVHNIIYSSSATVYGEPKYLPVDELHPVGQCTNPYGKSKYFCEEILKDLQYDSNNIWKIVILRYFNPVGAHPSSEIGENPRGHPNNIMPTLTQVAIGNIPKLKIFGNDYKTIDGTGVRDYIHIMDLSKGHINALDLLINSNPKNQLYKIYNLGSGSGYSIMQLINSLENVSNRKIPFDYIERRDGDIDAIYTSTKLAEKELCWKTSYTIDDICRDAWNWQMRYPNGYH